MTSSVLDQGSVTYAVADGIGTIRFHHPKSNSLPGALLRQLAATIETAGRDPAARVLIIRSEGAGPFCAGASFDEFRAVTTAEEGQRFFSGFAGVINAMREAPKFVMVRVHGKAVGGGIGITAAADYAYALRGASIKLSELAVGIGPFVVGPAIERRIGLAAFQQIAIDATEWKTADWAHQHGLYADVHDNTEALDACMGSLARRLAQSNPEAMAEMKKMFWHDTDHWRELLPARAAISGRLMLGEFTQRALAAM